VKSYSGKFIAIEGVDSSGKKTQAQRLARRLKEEGANVKYVEFPSYEDTELGKLVSRFLRGEFGDRSDVPVEVMSMFYAMDRYQFKQEYQEFLENGGTIVANRYSQSNLAFQTAELEGEAFDEMVSWLKNLESRLPQPDRVFVLDVDPVKAQSLMAEKDLREYLKGEEKDINEEKLGFQEKVAENYLRLAKRYGWTVIDCIEDGDLRSIEEINDELCREISLIK